MTKWEYAAIVQSGEVSNSPETDKLPRWILVQPGNENHFIAKIVYNDGGYDMTKFNHPWQNPTKLAEFIEKTERSIERGLGRSFDANDATPKILFESTDILHLVNLAGAEGWEITGGLGLANGGHGIPETKWRMMRREL